MSDLLDGIQRNISVSDIDTFVNDMRAEYFNARLRFGPCASYHEGLMVLKEELREVEQLTMERFYEHSQFHKELVQVAAMALAMDIENDPRAMPWNER